MATPILKNIELLTGDSSSIQKQLKEYSFNENPYIIDILSLENQESIIHELEKHFESQNIIYPIYIITSKVDTISSLSLVAHSNQVPTFYKKKSKSLNMKENIIYNKIKLKQKQLSNIDRDSVKNDINSYAFQHKNIFLKESYNEYLKSILKKTRDKK